MKTIKIAEASYRIEADAQAALEKYLGKLRRALKADGAGETMSDVELHITEILAERNVQPDGMIVAADVDAIRHQLGEPEQFDEQRDDARQSKPVRKGPWLLAVALVVLLAVPVAMYWDRIMPQNIKTVTETQDYQKTISSLNIAIESGDLQILRSDNNEISVERQLKWAKQKPTYREEWSGEQLRIKADCPENQNNCSVGYVVSVPRHVAVTAQMQVGDINIDGIEGKLHVTTNAGHIDVTETKNTLWARTNAGNITGARLGGVEADVQTQAGHVDLQFSVIPTEVIAKTTDGNVDVKVPHGQAFQVRAQTSTGERVVSVAQDSNAAHRIDAQTRVGSVTVQNF